MHYSRSMSFKVIKIGTNQKLVCSFLLVFHGKYLAIFIQFRKSAFFVIFTDPSLVLALTQDVPVT